MIEVEEISNEGIESAVDFTVEDAKGYYVDGVLTHNSRRKVSEALLSLGLDTGERTKAGDLKTSEDVLLRLKDENVRVEVKTEDGSVEEIRIGKAIADRNSLVKQSGSYMKKMSGKSEVHFNYKLTAAPTGRLASGGEKKGKGKSDEFFIPLNYQNLTKPDPLIWSCREGNSEESIMGYEFTPRSSKVKSPTEEDPNREVVVPIGGYSKTIEGVTQVRNVRRAISSHNRSEYLFCSIDYSQEELFLAGNFSRDAVMMEAFESGEDLHKKVAIQMWGKNSYNKAKRKRAKIANFGLLFDGNAWTLHNSSGLPIEECEEIYTKYWETMVGLKRWKTQQVRQCYANNGVCYTAFGRPRRLAYYLGSSNPKLVRFGERSVCSHIIQGSGADVMRIALSRLYEIIKKYGEGVIKFVGCVHDELNFLIRKDMVKEVIPQIRSMMEMKVPGCSLNLMTSLELGWSYGETFPFVVKDGEYTPKFEE